MSPPPRRTNSDPVTSVVFFTPPSAADLYPPVHLNPRDLEPFRRSTVTQSLIRDLTVERHRILDVAIRENDVAKRDELRGRLTGIEWVLGQLESYFSPNSDADGAPAMTTDINKEL